MSELFRFCESQYFPFILDIRVVYFLSFNTDEYVCPIQPSKNACEQSLEKETSFRHISNPQCRISVVLDPICTPNEIEKSAFPERATIIPLAKTA